MTFYTHTAMFLCACSAIPKSNERSISEDTLVHSYLHTPLQTLFVKSSLLDHKWANSSLESTRSTKNVFQPDFTSCISVYGHKFDLFIVEAKKPSSPISDLYKIGVMAKQMLDQLIKLGVPNPHVCALVVKGYECTSYRFDIQARSVYTMVEMNNFRLPHDYSELKCCPLLMQNLQQIKNIVVAMAQQVRTCAELRKRKKAIKGRIPESWITDFETEVIKTKKKVVQNMKQKSRSVNINNNRKIIKRRSTVTARYNDTLSPGTKGISVHGIIIVTN